MPLSLKDVTEILKLIDASECDELVLELEGARLVVRRNSAGPAAATFTAESGDEQQLTVGSSGTATSEANTPSPSAEPAPAAEAGMTHVRAPMVGTFYRRPSPDEPAFVEEGATVKKGDPLCLIEVMKLFTTIEAPADGTIQTIAPEDGSLVEFDQALFVIQTG